MSVDLSVPLEGEALLTIDPYPLADSVNYPLSKGAVPIQSAERWLGRTLGADVKLQYHHGDRFTAWVNGAQQRDLVEIKVRMSRKRATGAREQTQTIATARAELAKHEMVIQKTGYGDYRVYPKGTRDPDVGYFTDDLDDAVATGIDMAQRTGTAEERMMASRRKQQHLPGIEPGDEPIEIEIPTMEWKQIGGDMDPGTYGGTIATGDGHAIELIKIQPVREYVGDKEAAEVGFPFWTRTAYFDASDLDPSNRDVKSALNSIGMDLETLEADFDPTQRAIVIAEALLDYGRADEGPAGWSGDIGIPDKVEWSSRKEVAGAEYLADEDDAFRNEVLGYDDIRTAIEETVQRMADESSAQAWSTLGDQALSDLEDQGYNPHTAVDVAEFGDAVAVNGDINDRTMHAIEVDLETEGYEMTNLGGRIPSDEAHVSSEHVVRAVAKELGRSEEDVEKAAESLDWWQEEIPWSTSGDGSVWAKKKAGAEERRRPRRM